MSRHVSVLVVDDEQVIRTILARIVTREGYLVTEAVDGVDALEKMQAASFDYVITDIKMPRMDGLELVTKIKSLYPNTQMLLITGYGGEHSAEDILGKGVDFFITKPFKNVEISRTLAKLVAASERKRKTPAA